MDTNLQFPTFIQDLIECDEKAFKNYQSYALKLKLQNFDETLWCYAPSLLSYTIEQFKTTNKNAFIPISITGTKCQLQCKHCKSKILESMYPAETPDKLYNLVKHFVEDKNCRGVLLSGGATIQGMVPFLPFLDSIKKIKQDFQITVIIHSGLISEEFAKALADSQIDAVMLDIIGHEDTIHEIYHLRKNIQHFADSLRFLDKYQIPFVPHVILGLHYGELKGERTALELIKKYHPVALVLIVLMPLEGTPMEQIEPLSPQKIGRYVTLARLLFPDIPLMLGCARPKGDHKVETDIIAIKSGVNGIAYPSQEAVDYAIENGYKIQFSELCCSLVYKHVIHK
ncbi:MAG: radical SAM protein [Candidatus Helarchaeota archaeon]